MLKPVAIVIATFARVDKAQYEIVREMALRECMTIKEIIYAMFELGINRYEQKHGPKSFISRYKCRDKYRKADAVHHK